jgi:hypothetical protein
VKLRRIVPGDAEYDFTGLTAAMADYVGKGHPTRVVLLTRCARTALALD